jgi:methylenetetrahydrofolate dehydrogenase (NADP+)/methenyltetrahydrofolate cyclohydrolase
MKEEIKELRKEILSDIRRKRILYSNRDVTLVIIQVGHDPASDIYIRNKIKTCDSVGIHTKILNLHEQTSLSEIINRIRELAYDRTVHGIILQLPLPDHLKEHQQEILDEIPWCKDVDGLSTASIGRLWTGRTCLKPATAFGVVMLLNKVHSPKNKNVAIVSRSPLIGKPLIKMLLDKNATVKVYHTYSDKEEMEHIFEVNDIVITGMGDTFLSEFHDDYTTWIDCGIIRKEDGTICGDAGDLKSDYITPVPCGIGTLTTACVAYNTMLAYMIQKG